MHQSSRQNKNKTYKNWDSKSIKKDKDTRVHRSPRLLLELERRLDSTRLLTPDRASPALLLLNRNLYKCRTTSRVWCVNIHCEGVFIGGEWDLHQLGEVSLVLGGGRLASRVERPPPTFSADSGFSSLCRRVATKARPNRLKPWLGRSVALIGVTVMLGLCNPPRRGHGESAKPRLLYPLVWIPCRDTVN
jgi:hypothetical protein